jgi:hypothetical protein
VESNTSSRKPRYVRDLTSEDDPTVVESRTESKELRRPTPNVNTTESNKPKLCSSNDEPDPTTSNTGDRKPRCVRLRVDSNEPATAKSNDEGAKPAQL